MDAGVRLDWDPQHTWVFVVGTIEFKHPDYFASFPQLNRRDAALVEFFRGRNVPDGQLVYLKDAAASTQDIQQAFESHLKQSAAGDLLVLYYAGHGGKTDNGHGYFASYDAGDKHNPGWLVDDIATTVHDAFRGARALLMADCCYSGTLADAMARQRGTLAYACLTSSLASESSTGNWTFTEGLLAGFQGQAFVDADGSNSITLAELAGQIVDSMAFAEEQVATFAIGGGFDPRMVVAAARPRPDPQVGRRLEVLDGDAWYPAQVIDAKGGELKVHYYGYETSDDEWVTTDRTRDVVRPTYAVGSAVEVQWKKKWYPAKIIDVRDGVHCIHYDDFSADWDEWVASARIRPPS